jgi:hypothetical protein
VRESQFLGLKSSVMQQAREPFTGGLDVVKESGKRGLAAGSHVYEREDKITDGFLLMSVCVGQNEADILA